MRVEEETLFPRSVRLCNEVIETLVPPLGERVVEEEVSANGSVRWRVEALSEDEPATDPTKFFLNGVKREVDREHVTDAWFKYRRSDVHYFTAILYASLAQALIDACPGRMQVPVARRRRACRRAGVVVISVQMPWGVCPHIERVREDDPRQSCVLLPLYGKEVEVVPMQETVRYHHAFVVLEYERDEDEGTESPYYYVDFCPSRLAVHTYDRFSDDETRLPLALFHSRQLDLVSCVHRDCLQSSLDSRVYWFDDETHRSRVVQERARSCTEVAHDAVENTAFCEFIEKSVAQMKEMLV